MVEPSPTLARFVKLLLEVPSLDTHESHRNLLTVNPAAFGDVQNNATAHLLKIVAAAKGNAKAVDLLIDHAKLFAGNTTALATELEGWRNPLKASSAELGSPEASQLGYNVERTSRGRSYVCLGWDAPPFEGSLPAGWTVELVDRVFYRRRPRKPARQSGTWTMKKPLFFTHLHERTFYAAEGSSPEIVEQVFIVPLLQRIVAMVGFGALALFAGLLFLFISKIDRLAGTPWPAIGAFVVVVVALPPLAGLTSWFKDLWVAYRLWLVTSGLAGAALVTILLRLTHVSLRAGPDALVDEETTWEARSWRARYDPTEPSFIRIVPRFLNPQDKDQGSNCTIELAPVTSLTFSSLPFRLFTRRSFAAPDTPACVKVPTEVPEKLRHYRSCTLYPLQLRLESQMGTEVAPVTLLPFRSVAVPESQSLSDLPAAATKLWRFETAAEPTRSILWRDGDSLKGPHIATRTSGLGPQRTLHWIEERALDQDGCDLPPSIDLWIDDTLLSARGLLPEGGSTLQQVDLGTFNSVRLDDGAFTQTIVRKTGNRVAWMFATVPRCEPLKAFVNRETSLSDVCLACGSCKEPSRTRGTEKTEEGPCQLFRAARVVTIRESTGTYASRLDCVGGRP